MPRIPRIDRRHFLKTAASALFLAGCTTFPGRPGTETADPLPLLWDAHLCFPILPTADLSYLEVLKRSGAQVIGINVGMDVNEKPLILATLAHFRDVIGADPGITLIRRFSDIAQARAEGKLAVYLDFEGCNILEERPENVRLFSDLGVKQMIIAYKDDNSLGTSCSGKAHTGLTALGRKIVREMNRVGVLVDVSHLDEKTSLDIFEVSDHPVIASHSTPLGMKTHVRNASDAVIRGLAKTGGVININGFQPYLARPNTTTANYVDHIDYACQLVGPRHVGIGTDYVVNVDDMVREYRKAGKVVTPELEASYHFIAPSQYRQIAGELRRRGYGSEDVAAIVGGNMLRVANAVWAEAVGAGAVGK